MANAFITPEQAPTQTKSEMARLAARRARQLRPQWAAFARMLTRNSRLKIELTGGTPCTDGETMWLRVPIELGMDVKHIKDVCGSRGERNQLLCPACNIREDAMVTIFHESGHIISESFTSMDEQEKVALLKKAIDNEAGDNPGSSRPAKLREVLQRRNPSSFVGAARIISPWLGLLLNAVEDVRVNSNMFEARPGTKIMFDAQSTRIFEEGVLGPDGQVHKWTDQPVNAQIIIGVYCLASKLDYRNWLDEKVVEDLDDRKIQELARRVRTSRSVRSVFELAVQLLERLRELGYCKVPDEPEDDPEPEPQPEQEPEPQPEEQDEPEPQDGEGQSGDSGESDSSDEEDEDEGDQAEGEGEGDGGDAPEDDDSDEEESEGGLSKGEQDDPDAEGDEEGGNNQRDSGDGETESKGDQQDGNTSGSGADESEPEETGTSESEGGSTQEGDEESDDDSDEQSNEDGDEESDEDTDPEEGDGEGEGPGESEQESDMPMGPEPYTEEDLERDGTPDEAEDLFNKFGRHNDDGTVKTGDTKMDDAEVSKALVQEEYFDSPSENIHGVLLHKNLEDGNSWSERFNDGFYGTDYPIKIDERILSPALMHLRRTFADNRAGKHLKNLSTGRRINGRVLGRRVPVEDYRLFEKKELPGKKDHFVCVGLDVSGSTGSGVIVPIKESAFAMAELLDRLGVKFAVYAHTGCGRGGNADLDMYEVKSPRDRWDSHAKERLTKLVPSGANLDGHTMEFYRKVCERVQATDKLLMYYTDGAMPMSNFDEELEILEREIVNCRKAGINLVGVGVGNDDPVKYGLDTIRLDAIEDVPNVVKELQKRLR